MKAICVYYCCAHGYNGISIKIKNIILVKQKATHQRGFHYFKTTSF